MAGFLRDFTLEVRQAAAEALMWEPDARWPFARDGVREALADPKLSTEGAMFVGIGRLPAAAVADLTTWSSEHPPLAHRAILTLIEHYHTELTTEERPELASELATLMLNPETSPALRVELAALLRDHHLLSADLLDRLTNLDQPGPMRLFAAELMLRINPHDPDGIDVLRGLARQPNREMAIQIATVLQSVLGLQLGLVEGELPQPNTKQAADIARRVLAWANGADPDILRPTPGPRAGIKSVSRHSLPAIGSRPQHGEHPPDAAVEHSRAGREHHRADGRIRHVADDRADHDSDGRFVAVARNADSQTGSQAAASAQSSAINRFERGDLRPFASTAPDWHAADWRTVLNSYYLPPSFSIESSGCQIDRNVGILLRSSPGRFGSNPAP